MNTQPLRSYREIFGFQHKPVRRIILHLRYLPSAIIYRRPRFQSAELHISWREFRRLNVIRLPVQLFPQTLCLPVRLSIVNPLIVER